MDKLKEQLETLKKTIKSLLDEALGREVKIPEDPQMVGAYGAAIIAQH